MTDSKSETASRIKAEIIQSTVIPFAKIKLSAEPCAIFDSKVGGLPYLPPDADAPTDAKGNKLYLLAQINCEDIAGLPDFPHKGMLQFFISDDDLYGSTLTVPSPQKDWRVVYCPEIDRSVKPSAVAEVYADMPEIEFTPISHECKMTFEMASEGLTTGDYRFEQMFIRRWNEVFPEDDVTAVFDLDDEVFDIIVSNEDASVPAHKMCGYPFFTQADPRDEDSAQYDTLLFQLDTEFREEIGVMWGDLGVGNFFINREALKRLDFSDVLYNWDCG
jgi:Uncharacterized protein conserved in bacteria